MVLSDGGTVHVRSIRPDDDGRLLRFHERQSPESIYFRYFSPRPRLSTTDVARLTKVDGVDRMAFVGLLDDEMVGVARYDRYPSRPVAEVAFFIDDDHAGRGMATVLLEYLAAAARDVGITGFSAQVLPANRRMLGVFRQVGFEVTSRFSDGVIEVEFPIEPTPEASAAMAERARLAEARSVARILAPRSVAVIGASRRPESLGQTVFRRLLAGDFEGPVYPVNPEADVVASVRAHPSILDVPDEIDLAVVVVPAEEVAEVVEECGRKRVQGLVVISAGFAEAGVVGVARERALVEQARRLGLRLIGPNTMGVLNTAPHVRLLATFADVAPRPGRVAVSSQSGTIGAAVLRRLDQLGVGVSSFVATGNKADVSGNDLLQYWETDAATDVVVLYLESFGNPRNFARIARRVGRVKPVVAVKAGRGLGGPNVRPSAVAPGDEALPTPARSRGPDDRSGRGQDRAADALLAQTGVIRVDTLDELFDVTRVLAAQPLPPGPRVAILSTFWGPAVLAADACLAAGLELAPLGSELQGDLRAALPAGTRTGNPVELPPEAGPLEVTAAARALLHSSEVDALLVLHAPSLTGDVAAVAEAVGEVADGSLKTVVASFLGTVMPGDHPAGGVPAFAFPEAAAQALGRAVRYADWRTRQTGSIPEIDGVDAAAARACSLELLASVGSAGDGSAGDGLAGDGSADVGIDEAVALLATVGVAPVEQRAVVSLAEAIVAASAIGWPVALKALGVERPSRTEQGGVAVDLFDAEELSRSYRRMSELHGPAMEPALVQAMAPHGVDCRIEVLQHPVLGSILAFGPSLAGALQERILPLTDHDATELVDRGSMAEELAPVAAEGRAALVDLLLRLSALADAAPEVADLRLAPVIVSDQVAAITDVRLAVAPWPTDPAVRRLG